MLSSYRLMLVLSLVCLALLRAIMSDFFAGGFMVSANVTWRWVYGIGCIYEGLVTIAIFLFGEETYVPSFSYYLSSTTYTPRTDSTTGSCLRYLSQKLLELVFDWNRLLV